MRTNCVYCGKKIEKESREHIIQNALGGLYESADICCNKCNNSIISKEKRTHRVCIQRPQFCAGSSERNIAT